MKKNVFYLLSFFLLFALNLTAQQEHELDSSIPELSDFHEVIYPIWHSAYPEKDYAALRGYLEDVNQGASKVFSAELPGILRDKLDSWNKGVNEFKTSVEEFNAAVSGTDDEVLLKAAEKLHSYYENLVRIVRPVLKEVDEFHKDMYVIYHYYLPEKQYDKIKLLGDGLVLKAEAIAAAKLSKRLENKQDDFNSAAEDLLSSAKDLNDLLQHEKYDAIDSAVEKMHSNYQTLEAIF